MKQIVKTMKLNKIFLLAGIVMAGLSFSSCDDDDDYHVGNRPNENGYNVYFTDESALTLGLEDTEFTVALARDNGEGELTVPLKSPKSEYFEVPASVTFASGETEAEITVKVSDKMKTFTDYILNIVIPEQYTNPYVEDATSPRCNIAVVKEDFAPYAKGTYSEPTLFGDEWEQVLEYSELLDLYRFKNLIAAGANVYFKWNGKSDDTQEFYMTDADGNAVDEITSGYVHPSYGMIMMTVLDAFIGYDADDNAFYFPYSWDVSAGSFGSGYDVFTITEKY